MLVAIVRRQGAISTDSAQAAQTRQKDEKKTERPETEYAAAFARVRLVRAWIGVAAATVALGWAFNALLDRLLP
ncbi:MAG TPA: hypothetical protein VGP25_10205 [Gemmatimonadaceae bacterium]|jgi:hypothetical protein|nr:hypothetical protein [Gemmatimonadaceae bacterium]